MKWNRQSVPKRRRLNSKRRVVTQKKVYKSKFCYFFHAQGCYFYYVEIGRDSSSKRGV
jgi:hypothetical protein